LFTFDLGALKTVKLPKPPLVRAGLRPIVFAFVGAFVFFVTEDFCDAVDDDWFGVLPVFLGRRNERIDGRTPP